MKTSKRYFVKKDSVVRTIWGKSDTILFIFAGAAAEFACNKAVDWLYFTGKLPTDPIGRLFSTVGYARQIVFAEEGDAFAAIDKITAIHSTVEKNRNAKIPDWAYRDVLYMLIHYSIAAFELLERKLTLLEKEELYDVFHRMGVRMHLKDLPMNYERWIISRKMHLDADLQKSSFTTDLFKQYKKHLGRMRYSILLQAQQLVVPERVSELLGLKKRNMVKLLLPPYKLCRKLQLDGFVKKILLPAKYKAEIDALDIN